MTDLVFETLRAIGPCASSTLVERLVANHGLTAPAARQRVSRSNSIKKLAHLPLQRNARFVYLQEHYGSPEFWESLVQVLREHSVSYGGGLAALLARGGIMPKAHFAIACGAPLKQRGHPSPTAILDRLHAAKLIQSLSISGVGECVELSNQVAPEAYELARMRARLRTEEILLRAVKDWARRLGLASFDKIILRDEYADGSQPRVGTFCWDMTGPSYLAPMVGWSEAGLKPGFLVCDVLLGGNLNVEHLRPFINKCKTLRSLRNVGRCLQIFIADGYDKDAFMLARSEGVIPATPESLFGEEVAKSLGHLTDLLGDSYLKTDNIEKLDAVFSRLSRIEGVAVNLRGALFEYLAAEIVRSTSTYSYIRMNEIFRDETGRTAEVDVLVVDHNKTVRFIECKGYKPGGVIPDEMVARWLNDRIPLLRNAAMANPFWRNCEFQFEFWTTGQLSPESDAIVTEARQTVRKYSLNVVDREALEELGKASNNTTLKKTLQEHFLAHPFEAVEATSSKRGRKLSIPKPVVLEKRVTPTD
jgi:hypothetical protein